MNRHERRRAIGRLRRWSLALAVLLGITGFTATLSPSSAQTTDFAVGDEVATTDRLNLREDIGVDADVITVLDAGTTASVTDGPEAADDYDWYEIEVDGGDTGWVAGDFLGLADEVDVEFAAGDEVVVIDGSLNLRDDAGMDAEILDVMADGTAATIVSGPVSADDMVWYEIDTDDYGSGFAAGDFLALADDEPSDGFPVDTVLYVQTDDGSRLNLREDASVDAEIVDKLPDGSRVVVLDGPVTADGYDWYELDTDLGTGWSAGEFLVEASSVIEVGDTVTVVDGTLNLRDDATTDGEVLDQMPDGTTLEVTDGPIEADGYTWYEVENDDYGPGWAAGEFLQVEEAATDDEDAATATATATAPATATTTATITATT